MKRARRSRANTWLLSVMTGIVTGALVAIPGMSVASNIVGDNFHWSDGSNPRAYVTIADFTASQWPVSAATTEWGTEPNLDVYYVYQGCGSQGHCIDVRTQNFPEPCTGPGHKGGFATLFSANGHLTNDSFVRLNTACGTSSYSDRDRRALACEELGHIMGLAHGGDPTDTCMASGNITQMNEHPRPHDFTMLHDNIYNHNDP